MKKSLFIVLFCFPFILYAQQGMHSSSGEGVGDGGSFSFSFGQFVSQTYFDGSSSVAQGVQHPFEISFVPYVYSLFDSTFQDRDVLCFNAQETLTVAGDEGEVTVENGANIRIIAGQSISLLHGFHALPGSYVHAYITTDGAFCDGQIDRPIVLAPPATKSTQTENIVPVYNDFSSEMDVKIYPNPNNGHFTVNLINFENRATIIVYSLVGSVVHQLEMDNNRQTEIDLPSIRKGIYYVRVSSGKDQIVKKIILN